MPIEAEKKGRAGADDRQNPVGLVMKCPWAVFLDLAAGMVLLAAVRIAAEVE